MKIAMILRRHPPTRVSPIIPEVIRLLREWGATVEPLYPEERYLNLSKLEIAHDLYILKSRTELSLSLAGVLHLANATILNPYPVSMLLTNKIMVTHLLQKAGIPVPATYVVADPKQLTSLLTGGAVILKPYRGSEGQGVQVVQNVAELQRVNGDQGPFVAQRYYPPDGRDRKIYRIGAQIFGVKRVWPPRSYTDKLGEPFTITPDLRELVLRCGRALGIDLYGVDVVYSDGCPYVVDVSSFPGFKGVPNAALHLAEYLYAAGQRILRSEPLLMPAVEELVL